MSQQETSGPSPGESGAANTSSMDAGLLSRLLRSREVSVVFVLLALCLLMAVSEQRETFFSPRNIQVTLLYIALLAIFAIGETIVIITAGIDLSLGSMIAFTGMLVALFVTKLGGVLLPGPAIALAVLLTLLAALVIGVLHATLIHRLRLPPFVVTLASLLILRSQSLVVNNQLPISISEYPPLLYLAQGGIEPKSSLWFAGDAVAVLLLVFAVVARRTWLWPSLLWLTLMLLAHRWAWHNSFAMPVPILILVFIALIAHLLLSRARIGRYLYSIGSNEQATRLSGVNVYRVKLFAYGASAFLGGLAGILWAAYGTQGDPLAASGYELDAVAAAVVGGANLMGGQGSVIGTILGATLLHVILSAINLNQALASPDIWRGTVVGGVLLFAVLVTALQQRRAE